MATVHLTHDTSHYDECRSIMERHKRNHKKRTTLLFILIIMNGYFHIVPMPMLRADGAFARNAIFTSGFGYAVLAFLVSIGLLAVGFLATSEKPTLIRVGFVLIGISLIFGLINPIILLFIFVLFLLALFETKKAAWVKQQPGYPYFSERFYEQMENFSQNYKPDHNIRRAQKGDMSALENATDRNPLQFRAKGADFQGTMPDLDPEKPIVMASVPEPPVPAAQTIAEIPEPVPAPSPVRTKPPKPFAAPAAEAPLPEPELPDTNFDIPTEIPDPVWDLPDPAMNTADILSDFPEVNGDIPDLPDIPDIPKL